MPIMILLYQTIYRHSSGPLESLQFQKKDWNLRQAAFASGPPPYYYQLLLLLNFVGLMGYGVFNRV